MPLLLIALGLVLWTTAFAASTPLCPEAAWPVATLPAAALRTDVLEPDVVWRLDCGEDAEVMVGRLIAAAAGQNGRVLLVDAQLDRVLVVGPDGRVDRTVGSPGEGPGEIADLFRTFQHSDGRIGLLTGREAPFTNVYPNVDVVFLDYAGDPAGIWPLSDGTGGFQMLQLRDWRHAGSQHLMISDRVRFERPTCYDIHELALVNDQTGQRDVIARRIVASEMSASIDEVAAFEPFAHRRSDIDRIGRVAWAPRRDAWEIAVRQPDGTGLLLRRPWRSRERSRIRRDRLTEAFGGAETCDVADTDPCTGRVRWRPDGHLWVEVIDSEDTPAGFIAFDEVTADGRLLRRVELVLPGDPATDTLVMLGDGRLVLLGGCVPLDGNVEAATSPHATLLASP